MKTEMIKIYAEEENSACLAELIETLAEKLEIRLCDRVIVDEGFEPQESVQGEYLVISSEEENKYKAEKKLTYSLNGISGDVSLLNVQERTQSKSFEILCGSFMGRVFLPYSSKYTEKQVLVCVALMLSLEADAKALLEAVNEIIK